MTNVLLLDKEALLSLGQLSLIIILSLSALFIYRIVYPRLVRTDPIWNDTLLKAAHLPLQIAIWVCGSTFILENFSAVTSYVSFKLIGMHIRELTIYFTVVWFLLRYIRLIEYRIINGTSRSTRFDRAKLLSISKLSRVIIITLGIVLLMQAAGIPISGLLAFGGAGALIVGLAAKDLLANFFGGLLIYTDRPFTVGDWIASPNQDIEGTVEEIGWRLTKIRRFDRRVLYIPNSIFSNISVENVSRMSHRRLQFIIGLRYKDLPLMDSICKEINAFIKTDNFIDQTLGYYAKLNEFSSSSINIKIVAYSSETSTEGFMELQHRILLKIAEIVKNAGADFAFPTQTLDIPDPVAIKQA